MEKEVIPGGWTAYSSDISGETKQVFEKALKGLKGVDYSPTAVASQVVSGVNYSFFCNAKGVYPGALNEGAMIEIYKPLQGDPHIVSISKTQR